MELKPAKDETLIIDTDDTLWENNIFYEKATDRFLELVEARGVGKKPARQHLTAVERKNVPLYGYGSQCFARSLRDTLARARRGCGRRAPARDRTLRRPAARVSGRSVSHLTEFDIVRGVGFIRDESSSP